MFGKTRNIIKESVHKLLLEYASFNDEVHKVSNSICEDILTLEKYMETHNEDYEDLDCDYVSTYLADNRFIERIDWQDLPKPTVHNALVGPVGLFNKEFVLSLNIVYTPSSKPELEPKYKSILKSNVTLGKNIITSLGFLNNTLPVIVFNFTSGMIDDGSFRSIVDHEIMHAFQHEKEITSNNAINYLDITNSNFQKLRTELAEFKKQDPNLNYLLFILYILSPTERSAWTHQIASELQVSSTNFMRGFNVGFLTIKDAESVIKSDYYQRLKKAVDDLVNVLGSAKRNEMIGSLSHWLSKYINNSQSVSNLIINSLLKYIKKINKVYYQHKQDIINKLYETV